MIYDCLLAPSENPYSLTEIKKALLTYDKIKILDPSDRDLMPSSLFHSAVGTMPFMGIEGPAVRPMGKTLGYDDYFEKMIEQLKPAIQQGLVEIITIFTKPQVHNQNTSIFFGIPPRYDYPLNENLIYSLYRGLAENKELISSIVNPIKHSLLSKLQLADKLALTGMADNTINNGVQLPFIEDPTLSDLERGALTRIARARISTLIKCSGYCELKDIVPVFNGAVYGQVLTHVMNKSHETLSEIEDDEFWVRRNRVMELCHEEFIDDSILDAMSIKDVIKLRSIIWGKNAARREALFQSIGEIALESTSDTLFRQKSIDMLTQYRESSESLCKERERLNFKIKCDITKGVMTAGPAVAGCMGQLSLGWSMGLTLLGAAPWAIDFFKENKEHHNEIKAKEKEIKRSACFGLHDFYSRIK